MPPPDANILTHIFMIYAYACTFDYDIRYEIISDYVTKYLRIAWPRKAQKQP